MKTKLLTWLIVLLLLVNAATLSIFWMGRVHHDRAGRHPDAPESGPKEFIIKELSFNAEQQRKYSSLVEDHRAKADEYLENIRVAKNSFFSLLKDSTVGELAKKKAMEAVNTENEKLDLLTFEHFQKVRALGNEQQKKKFDSIIVQALEMMARPKGPAHNMRFPEGAKPDLEGKRPLPPARMQGNYPDGPPPKGEPGRYGPPHHEGRPPIGPPPEDGQERYGPPPGRDGMPPPQPPR